MSEVNVTMPTPWPIFDGSSQDQAQAHWYSFQDALEERNLQGKTDKEKCAFFRRTLINSARLWFADNAANIETVNDLREKFLERFQKFTTRRQRLEHFQSLHLKDGEDLQSYKNRVILNADRAGFKGDKELVLIKFIDGLPSHIRTSVKARRDATLDEAMQTASTLLDECSGPSRPEPLTQHMSSLMITQHSPRGRSPYKQRQYDRSDSHGYRR
jgi:hypothetical protein